MSGLTTNLPFLTTVLAISLTLHSDIPHGCSYDTCHLGRYLAGVLSSMGCA